MDELLSKHKKLFVGAFIVLAVLALWHLYYVIMGMNATGHSFLLSEYGVLALGLTMLSLCTGIFLLCTNHNRELIWIVAFFLLAISSMRVMPGLSAPDEPSHYISAYYLSNQLMMIEPDDEDGRVRIRKQDVALEDVNEIRVEQDYAYDDDAEIFGQVPAEKNYYELRNWNKNHEVDPGMTTSAHIRVVTSPLVYLPQAIGICIARMLNCSSVVLLTLGKLMNLLAFCAMAFWAVRRMPFGKTIMMAVTLLPMTINLAASMSYDAMLIGGSFMFIAQVLHLAYDEDKVEWKDIILLAVILAVISPCKIVYSLMVFLILLIPKEKYRTKLMHVMIWVICIIAAIGSMMLVNATVISSYASTAVSDVPWSDEPGFTVYYVLHHPLDSARVFYDTLMYQGSYYHETMLGAYLGNLCEELDVPFIVLLFMTLALFALPLSDSEQDRQLSLKHKIIIAAVCAVIFGLLLGSMMIAWTPISSPVILGVQGRYFLPFLPILLLLIRNRKLALNRNIDDYVIFLMVCCDAFVLFRLYSMICLYIPR